VKPQLIVILAPPEGRMGIENITTTHTDPELVHNSTHACYQDLNNSEVFQVIKRDIIKLS